MRLPAWHYRPREAYGFYDVKDLGDNRPAQPGNNTMDSWAVESNHEL